MFVADFARNRHYQASIIIHPAHGAIKVKSKPWALYDIAASTRIHGARCLANSLREVIFYRRAE